MELGKRLNILREQVGREQAASLEETYKQSRDEGEEEETGEKSGRHEAAGNSIKQTDILKDQTEGENNIQVKKVDHVNVSLLENEMDQDQTEHGESETGIKSMSFNEKENSQGDNSLVASVSAGANQKEENTSEVILSQNQPEKNLEAVDESQYPLPDTGSKANLDFVTLKAQPTFPRNTKFSKEARNAWKRIMSGKEREMPVVAAAAEEGSEQGLSRPTNEVIAADPDAKDTNSKTIKFNLNNGEHMLRSLGSSRSIRRKLPIRTT